MAAQLAHAAGESSPGGLPEGTYAIVLAVPDEKALLAVANRLQAAGLAHVLIREPDAPWNSAATAIGLVPIEDRSKAQRCLSSLPLLRGKPTARETRALFLAREGAALAKLIAERPPWWRRRDRRVHDRAIATTAKDLSLGWKEFHQKT